VILRLLFCGSISIFIIYVAYTNIACAAQATAVLPVSVSVSANCTLTSAILGFGNYDPIAANKSSALNGVTNFQIGCTKGANVNITLGNGLYSANGVGATRAMTDGNDHYLSYELYSDAGRGQIWNVATPVQYVPSTSAYVIKTVYGRVMAGQNVAPGNYRDTVVITANF
jgi:spore coat protein U-like protein